MRTTIPPYAASTDPRPPATMTESLYDQPHTPIDGQFFPTYRQFCDIGSASENAAASASGKGGEQPAAGFSATSQIGDSFPHGWTYGLGDVELFFSASSPDLIADEAGHGLHAQFPWEYGAQAYSSLMGGTVAMTSPTSEYFPAEESMDGRLEPVKWPPTPMGQLSPSPSQSSHHDSSPASVSGPQSSRQTGCQSLPASRAAAVEQSQFDARFRPMPDQVVSPGDRLLTPGGLRANSALHIVTEFLAPADNQRTRPSRRNTKNQTVTTTATTDYNAGTLSPAATPSPKDGTATTAAPNQPTPHSAPRSPDQQIPRSNRRKHSLQRAPHPPTAQQKQKQKQEAGPKPPTGQRARNRAAANKCRAKTKLAVADLESTERAMSSEHRELSATARRLRDEVLLLKNALLAHGNCGDDLIQQYLTNQARMVGAGAATATAHRKH